MASLTLLIATLLGPIRGIDPFHTWFFCFAWWSMILAGEALLTTRGRSLLFGRPLAFVRLCLLSLFIWLFFEVLNFRLGNWHYIGLPATAASRWLGYAISFSTVLPGLRVAALLFEESGIMDRVRWPALPLSRGVLRALPFFGLACLVLPMIFPRFAFPLVWIAMVPLLDPLLLRAGRPSLFLDWSRGAYAATLCWLAGGAVCGLLWEMWNAKAGAKWIYTIPFVPWPKLFEMPLLGFLGFPPFALECLVLWRASHWLAHAWNASAPARSPAGRVAVCLLLCLAAAAFCALVFSGIDRFTVLGFRTSLP